MGDPEFTALAVSKKKKKALRANIRQRKFVKEYVKTGNATAAALAVYNMNKKSAHEYSLHLLNMPKIHDIENTVMEEIQMIEGVESTLTLLCVDEKVLE